jgi:hypothetical protein
MNNPLDSVWNVGHRKPAATRSFRMPALLGALPCAAGLLVSPGKTISQVPEGVFSVTDIERQGSSYAPGHGNNLFTEFGNNKAKAL